MILIGFLKWGVKRCNASLFKFASEAGVCELRGKKRLKRILGFGASGWLAEGDNLPRRKIASYSVKNRRPPGRLSTLSWIFSKFVEKSRKSWIAILLLPDSCLWRAGLPSLPTLFYAFRPNTAGQSHMRLYARKLNTSQPSQEV